MEIQIQNGPFFTYHTLSKHSILTKKSQAPQSLLLVTLWNYCRNIKGNSNKLLNRTTEEKFYFIPKPKFVHNGNDWSGTSKGYYAM